MAVLVSIAITGPTGTAFSALGPYLLCAGNAISLGKAKTLITCRMIIHCARRCFASPRSFAILNVEAFTPIPRSSVQCFDKLVLNNSEPFLQ